MSTMLALATGCSLLFEPGEGTGQQCPEHVTRVERLALAEQPGPGGHTAATYSLPPSCGPWLVALSAQISSTSVEDCTAASPCGLATLLVDGDTRSMVGAGQLSEGAASWVDTVVVGASDAPTELTVDLLGGTSVDVGIQLAQLELVAIPLPPGTTLDAAHGPEMEVVGTDWIEVTRLDGQNPGDPQLALATGCGTEAPDFGLIAFQILVDGSDNWPPSRGPQNGKAPVRCAPLFTELAGGSDIALEVQGSSGPDLPPKATAVLGRIQSISSPPGAVLRQGPLSSQLQLNEPATLASAQLEEGSFLVIAIGALRPDIWVEVSEPRFEMKLALEAETVQSYESSIVSRANRLAQGFVRRVQGPDTVTLSATIREFKSPDTTVYANWSSLLIIPAP